MFAIAALPVPALLDVTALVVLTMFPADVPVTFTLNVHEPFAAMLAPDKVTPFDPGAAVTDPPPHDPVRPFGVATTKPAGNVSVNPTPVSTTVLALAMVKLRLVVPLIRNPRRSKRLRDRWRHYHRQARRRGCTRTAFG